jgi:zinc transport system ATP-binding protein
MSVVALDHVGMSYDGVRALEDITVAIERGDFMGIIGPNGSGKTTLLKLMLGLLVPTEGEVRLFDTAPSAFRAWHRIGYVPQRTVFDQSLPVRVDEVVGTGLVATATRWSRAAARRRVSEVLQVVGLAGKEPSRVGALSAGQQQRVLIARALVCNPELLILDEPTGGVDPEAQAAFHALLQRLNSEQGVTLVLVSHDIGVVARDVTRLACLNRRVIFCGSPNAFFTDPRLSALYGEAVRVVGHAAPCAHAG